MKKMILFALVVFPLVFNSCTKEEDELITTLTLEKTLYFGDEYQIEATSSKPITYSSEDKYHASVSTSGLVTARFVGETNIVMTNGKDTKKIRILIKAVSNLYPNPNLEFGITKSALIAKLGTPTTVGTSGISYSNFSSAAPIVMYVFDENNKLESSSVLVNTLYSSSLGTYLAERYYPVDVENLIFANAIEYSKITMLVGADLYNTTYWLVLYMPYTSTTASSIMKKKALSIESKKVIHQFEYQILN